MEENQTKLDEANLLKDDRVKASIEPVQPMMIPVHMMSICGDNNTPPETRLSYSQVAFVTKEQYDIIRLRIDDMARTINGFIAENEKRG